MELAFLTSAVRRYFWIVVLGAVLGALPGLYMTVTAEEFYESRAVLLIAPPTQTRATVVNYQGDPDRYVAGEMSVLESLSDRVAESVEGVAPGDLAANVTFEQQPLTDVVVIVAKAATPELAQQIADAYVTEYFEVLRTQLAGTQGPAIEEIDLELEELKTEMDALDAQIATAMARFIEREAVPTVEQVAPQLASEKAALTASYSELQATRSELNSGLRVASRTVREANLPTEPVSSSSRMLILAGIVAGGFLGLLAAVVVARLSRSVIDDEQAEEILGHYLVGTMPDWPELGTGRAAIFDPPGAQIEQFLDSLGVRVEAVGQGTGTVTAVVCGVRSSAGTTTLASALAVQLASPDVTVLLVDGDRQHPEISALLGSAGGNADHEVVDTTVDNLQFVTLAGLTALASSPGGDRRPNAETQLSVASSYADVVIIDGGALMGSASTVQLSRVCDVVLLAIPRRQSTRGLEGVSNELRSRNHLLPVWVPVGGRASKRSFGGRSDDPTKGDPIEVDEVTPAPTPRPPSSRGTRSSTTARNRSGSSSAPRPKQRS